MFMLGNQRKWEIDRNNRKSIFFFFFNITENSGEDSPPLVLSSYASETSLFFLFVQFL